MGDTKRGRPVFARRSCATGEVSSESAEPCSSSEEQLTTEEIQAIREANEALWCSMRPRMHSGVTWPTRLKRSRPEVSADARGSSHPGAVIHLRLYVAGRTPLSTAAVENLRRLCDEHLSSFDLEIFDVALDAVQALEDGIVVTPTLVKVQPGAMRMVVGDLSDAVNVLRALELSPEVSVEGAESIPAAPRRLRSDRAL